MCASENPKKGRNMKNKIYIEDNWTLNSVEYDIVSEYDGKVSTIASCWDYILAERIRDAVVNYMKENYKINTKEETK